MSTQPIGTTNPHLLRQCAEWHDRAAFVARSKRQRDEASRHEFYADALMKQASEMEARV